MGRGIWLALRDIHTSEGWRGLYRGLSPNIAGNASSWGLYFLLYVFFFGVTRSCRIRLSLFAEIFSLLLGPIACLHQVITSSSVAPPSNRLINLFLPLSISSTLPKRVRSLLASLDGTLFNLPSPPFRCCDSHPDKSNMGGQSTDIHRAVKLARRTQRPLEYVALTLFHHPSI